MHIDIIAFHIKLDRSKGVFVSFTPINKFMRATKLGSMYTWAITFRDLIRSNYASSTHTYQLSRTGCLSKGTSHDTETHKCHYHVYAYHQIKLVRYRDKACYLWCTCSMLYSFPATSATLDILSMWFCSPSSRHFSKVSVCLGLIWNPSSSERSSQCRLLIPGLRRPWMRGM